MKKQDSANEHTNNSNGKNGTTPLSNILTQKPRITEADTENLNDKATSEDSFNANFNRAVKNISGYTVKRNTEAVAS